LERLIFKGASAWRSSGQWRDDDYDVLEDGVIVGRINRTVIYPQVRRSLKSYATNSPTTSGRPSGQCCRTSRAVVHGWTTAVSWMAPVTRELKGRLH